MFDILGDIDVHMKTVKLQASFKIQGIWITNDNVGQYMLGCYFGGM